MSSLDPSVAHTPIYINVTSGFQMYIDHSVVELYSGDYKSVASFRLYPTLGDALGFELIAQNASVVFNVDAWQLGNNITIWN